MYSTSKSGSDTYLTPARAWNEVLLHIPENTVLWESAYHPDSVLSSLRENVFSEDINFFTHEPEVWDIQMTNPPFSRKLDWLIHSLELRKPFVLLLPGDIIHRKYFRNILAGHLSEVQLMIPSTRIQFTGADRPNFECLWVTWGLNLPRAIMFL
jgi:hypothetical protein